MNIFILIRIIIIIMNQVANKFKIMDLSIFIVKTFFPLTALYPYYMINKDNF